MSARRKGVAASPNARSRPSAQASPPDAARRLRDRRTDARRVAPAELPDAAAPSARATLLRFVSCGILSVGAGAIWRFTLAPHRLGIGSALAGILVLLAGFVAGGLVWYAVDARRRARDPRSVSDARIVFSFVVFVLVPLAVLFVVALVWLLALLVGAG